ncbi:MAG: hypothetical protein JSR21_07305 [Proteobacteria bacterium]|nr:hypothetical protein [Pseudomonadota bacterium]
MLNHPAATRMLPESTGAFEAATLFAKAHGDSGSSLHARVERRGVVAGRPAGTVAPRNAADELGALPMTRRTLVKLDTEGSEYRVLPRIAGLLAERMPVLHVSFHLFNLQDGTDEYRTAQMRLTAGLAAAGALACYPLIYARAEGRWMRFDPADPTEWTCRGATYWPPSRLPASFRRNSALPIPGRFHPYRFRV